MDSFGTESLLSLKVLVLNNYLQPDDDFERIKEGVASILVEKIGSLFNGNYLPSILNPNMVTEMLTSEDNLQAINLAKEKYTKQFQEEEFTGKTHTNCDVLLDKYAATLSKIPILTDSEFESFLIQQSSRFKSECEPEQDVINNETLLNNFLEVITDDAVLTLIAKKLVKTLSEFSLVMTNHRHGNSKR